MSAGRTLLALLPAALVMASWDFLPAPIAGAPAAVFYPCVFAAILIGGIPPALLVTVGLAASQVFFIQPQFFFGPATDPKSIVRVTMFIATASFSAFLIDSQRKSREHLVLALRAAEIGAWEANTTTGRVKLDAQAARCFGSATMRPTFADLMECIHPDDRAQLSGRETVGAELRVGERWVRASMRLSPPRMLGTVMDITAKKQMEDELRHAVKVRDDFLSLASHELRTPLTALKLQLQLLMKQLQATDPLSSLLRRSDAQVDRLANLIGDVLDLSRATRGSFTVTRRDIDASDLVQATVASMLEMAGAATTPLSAQIEPGIRAAWDPARIGQLVANLIGNALKYGDGAPVVVTLTKAVGGDALIVVRDQGPGIALSEHERIFGRFERLDLSNTQAGLGLGLFICREIVQAHGGRIWVDSVPGKGAAFSVSLPLLAPG